MEGTSVCHRIHYNNSVCRIDIHIPKMWLKFKRQIVALKNKANIFGSNHIMENWNESIFHGSYRWFLYILVFSMFLPNHSFLVSVNLDLCQWFQVPQKCFWIIWTVLPDLASIFETMNPQSHTFHKLKWIKQNEKLLHNKHYSM